MGSFGLVEVSPLTEDYNGQSGLLRGLLVPSLQELYTSRVRKRLKVTLDPSHPAHLSLNCCPLAGATEH